MLPERPPVILLAEDRGVRTPSALDCALEDRQMTLPHYGAPTAPYFLEGPVETRLKEPFLLRLSSINEVGLSGQFLLNVAREVPP